MEFLPYLKLKFLIWKVSKCCYFSVIKRNFWRAKLFLDIFVLCICNTFFHFQKYTSFKMFQHILKDFCNNSSIHGLKFLTKPKRHWIERWVIETGFDPRSSLTQILTACKVYYKCKHRKYLESMLKTKFFSHFIALIW